MKLCKDCKHIGKSPFGNLTYCTRVVGTNLLDGSPEYVDNYCTNERSAGWLASRLNNLCGKEGRFYEEKEDNMQDRNPASPSKICPKCKAKAFRLSIGTMFIRVYGCYCKNCGYTTEPSVSQLEGCKEWHSALID